MSVQRGSSYLYDGVFKRSALKTTTRLEWFLGVETDARASDRGFGVRLVLSDDRGCADQVRLMRHDDVEAGLREVEEVLSRREFVVWDTIAEDLRG